MIVHTVGGTNIIGNELDTIMQYLLPFCICHTDLSDDDPKRKGIKITSICYCH